MSATLEKFRFELYVTAGDETGYRERHRLLAELRAIPELKVSSADSAAGSNGMEQWMVTIIATVANIATIANFLYSYFRKDKKKKKGTRESLVVSADAEGRIILNELTREGLIKVIETRSSYILLDAIPRKNQKKVERHVRKPKAGTRNKKAKKKEIGG